MRGARGRKRVVAVAWEFADGDSRLWSPHISEESESSVALPSTSAVDMRCYKYCHCNPSRDHELQYH